MKPVILTHDLSCTIGQLSTVARRFPNDATTDVTGHSARDLFMAAVAFTIQLAIDEAGRDPAEMRALERDLFAVLES